MVSFNRTDRPSLLGLIGLVGLLLSCAKPPTAVPVNRVASLVLAVRGDSVAAVRELLAGGLSVDAIAPDGTRPLTEAARHGRVAVMRVLLDAGARLDLADSSGARPFDYAIERGHRMAAALLARHAAVDAGASRGALEWFDALTGDPGRLPDWRRVLDGETASLGLLYAVLVQRDNVVAALRRAGGLPNRTGYVALSIAARFGDEPAVTALLQSGANPDVEVSGHLHETPLMEASREGYVAIGKRLIRAGARVDHVDDYGDTALMWAVQSGETDYAVMLLDAGAKSGLRNKAGDTALDMAHRINHADLIALLESRRGASSARKSVKREM